MGFERMVHSKYIIDQEDYIFCFLFFIYKNMSVKILRLSENK